MESKLNVGLKIKEYRTNLKLSRKMLSELSGVSAGYLEEIESNKKTPTVDIILKFANALNVSLSDIIVEANNNTVPLTPELKELVDSAKFLSREQLKKLTEFVKTMR